MVADIGVLGFPFDGGNTISPGACKGPAAIRWKSWQYQYRIDFRTGQPAGWFDVDADELLLNGLSILDWGEVRFTHGEPAEAIFERAHRVCSDIVESGAFPVLLGGDHSVSYPLIQALQKERPLTVLWLDAHLDNAAWNPNIHHHHANVVTRILSLPNLERVIHIGHRGYLNTGKPSSEDTQNQTILSTGRLRRLGIAEALKCIPAGCDCYLSIDVDILDPAYAPATSTPVPCGLTPAELKQLLREIGNIARVVGLDLVELNPSNDNRELTSLLASEMLMVAVSSSMRSAARPRSATNDLLAAERGD
jgi:agmatinase